MEGLIQESFAPIQTARHSFSSLSDSNNGNVNGSWYERQELDPRHANSNPTANANPNVNPNGDLNGNINANQLSQLNQPHLQIPYAAETNSLPSYQHHHLHHNQHNYLPHHQLHPQHNHHYQHFHSTSTPSSFSSPTESSPSGSPYHPYPARHRPPPNFPLFLAQPASATPINVDPVGAGQPSSFNRYSTPPSSYLSVAPAPPTRTSDMEVLTSPQNDYVFTSTIPHPYGGGGSGGGGGGGGHFGTSGVGIHRRRPSLLTPSSWPYTARTHYGYNGAGNVAGNTTTVADHNNHNNHHNHHNAAAAATTNGYESYAGVDETPSSAGGHFTSGHTTPVWQHPHSAQPGAGTPYYNPPPFNARPMQPPLLLGTGSTMPNMSSGIMMDAPTANHPPPPNGSHAMGSMSAMSNMTSPADGYGPTPMGYMQQTMGAPSTTLSNNNSNIRAVHELESSFVTSVEQIEHVHHTQHGQHNQHNQHGQHSQHIERTTGYPASTNMGIYANEHDRGGALTAQRFDTSIPPAIPPIPPSPTTITQPSHPTNNSSRPVHTSLVQGSESNTNGVQPANGISTVGIAPGMMADQMPAQALSNSTMSTVSTLSPVTPITPIGHGGPVGAASAIDGQRPIDDSGNNSGERMSTNRIAVTDDSEIASASCASNKGEVPQDAVNHHRDQGGEAVGNKLTAKANTVENDEKERTAAKRECTAEPKLASRSNAAVHGDSSNGACSDQSIQIRHHDEESQSNSEGVAVASLSRSTALVSMPVGVPELTEGHERHERYERFGGTASLIGEDGLHDSRANDTGTASEQVNQSIVNGGHPTGFKGSEHDPRLGASEPAPPFKTAPESYSSITTTTTPTTTTSTTNTAATINTTTTIATTTTTTSPSTEHHSSQSPQTPSHPSSSNMQAVQAMPYQHGSHAQVPTPYPYHHHDPTAYSSSIPPASNFNPHHHIPASTLRPEWRRSSYPSHSESQAQNGFSYSRGPQATAAPTSSTSVTGTGGGGPVRHSMEEGGHGRSLTPSPLGPHHRHSLPNISSSSEASAPPLASGHYTPGGRLVPAAFPSGPPSHRSGSSASSTPPSVAVTAPVAHYSFDSTSSPHSHFEPSFSTFQTGAAAPGVYGQGPGHRSGNDPVFYQSYPHNMGYHHHQPAGQVHFDGRIRHSSTSPAPPMITGGKRGREDEWDVDGVDSRGAQRRRLSHPPTGSLLGSDGSYTTNGSPLLHHPPEMGVIRMAGYVPASLKDMGIREVIGEPFQAGFGGIDKMVRRRPEENGHDGLSGVPGSRGGAETSYSFISLPGNTVRKRPRRKFEEITRNYICNWPGCTKAYGTLNHLNAHVTMQKHGPKRVPSEFKEMRKVWRKQKREQQQQQAMQQQQGGGHSGMSDLYHDDDGDNGDDDYDEGSLHTGGISI